MSRRGFTLIELLVVIAIIAILAAILFPVLSTAREKARQSTCLQNMTQLARAFRMYLDDYNGFYPGVAPVEWLGSVGNRDTTGSWVWFDGKFPGSVQTTVISNRQWSIDPAKGSIWKYTNKSRKIYMCPSDEQARRMTKTGKTWGLSYSLNWSFNMYPAPTGNGDYFKDQCRTNRAPDSGILRPTKTVLLIDEGAGTMNITPNGYGRITPQIDGCFRYWQAAPAVVHTGGCNVAYCDGHAKWVKQEKFPSLIYRTDGVGSPGFKY